METGGGGAGGEGEGKENPTLANRPPALAQAKAKKEKAEEARRAAVLATAPSSRKRKPAPTEVERIMEQGSVSYAAAEQLAEQQGSNPPNLDARQAARPLRVAHALLVSVAACHPLTLTPVTARAERPYAGGTARFPACSPGQTSPPHPGPHITR